MKKGKALLAGLLGLIAGQAITVYSKDKKLRKDISEKEGVLWKGKVLLDKLVETNKNIVNEITENDWQATASTIREDVKHDSENVKEWIEEKKNVDWKKEGKQVVDSIIEKAPTKNEIEETVQKSTDKIRNRWNNLMDSVEEKVDEVEETLEKKWEVIKEKIADKIDETAESMKAKIKPTKEEK